MPTIAIAPGETIRENMNFLGMNQKELAARLEEQEKLTDDLNKLKHIYVELQSGETIKQF